MTGKRSCKPILFSQDRLLEFHDVGERILAEQYAAGIHGSAAFVIVAPDPGWTIVFQRKPQRIDLSMAAGAICPLPMCLESFAERQILLLSAFVLAQRWDVGRWRIRRIIENDTGDPGATRDRFRS